MITDLEAIERFAIRSRHENDEFRAYIKGWLDWSDRRLNQLVRETTEEVWSRIDCTTCANCCRLLDVVVTDADVQRLADHLKMTTREFEERYVSVDEENEKLLSPKPCPFLQENQCAVYDHRPRNCEDYPNLQKDFRTRTVQHLENCDLCPIVFNVLERLKQKLPWRGRRRHRGW